MQVNISTAFDGSNANFSLWSHILVVKTTLITCSSYFLSHWTKHTSGYYAISRIVWLKMPEGYLPWFALLHDHWRCWNLLMELHFKSTLQGLIQNIGCRVLMTPLRSAQFSRVWYWYEWSKPDRSHSLFFFPEIFGIQTHSPPKSCNL